MEYSSFILGNGIRCVHRRTKSKVSYCSISINSGARDEVKTHDVGSGIAHLTEHMLFRGTQKFSSYEISKRLESRGGDLNAYTGKEETVVHALSLTIDFSRAMELIKEMVFNSKFTPKDIESEKEIIVDEINSYKDSPSELIYDDFEELLFAGSGLGRSILGDKKRLVKVKREDILNYTSANFITSQMVVSSSGDITHDRFRVICERVFESIEASSRADVRVTPTTVSHFDVVKNRHTHQVHSLIGGYAPKIESNDRIAVSLLCNILAGPFSMSLLNQSLREKRSITYNIESSYTPYTDNGFFTIYFSCMDQKRELARELIVKQFNQMRQVEMTSAKFGQFKRQFLGQLIIANENQESMMLAVAKSLLIFGHFESQETIYKKIDSLTQKDVLEAANLILNDDNLFHLTYL